MASDDSPGKSVLKMTSSTASVRRKLNDSNRLNYPLLACCVGMWGLAEKYSKTKYSKELILLLKTIFASQQELFQSVHGLSGEKFT